MRKLFTFTLLAISAICPTTLTAQMSRSRLKTPVASTLAPAPPPPQLRLTMPPPAGSPNPCDYFFNSPYSKALAEKADHAKLKACAESLIGLIESTGGRSKTEISDALTALKKRYTTTDDQDEVLIETHYESRLLERWAGCKAAPAADPCPTLSDVDNSVHDLMGAVGLMDPFAGSLVAGPVLANTGKLAPGSTATSTGSTGAATGATGTAAASSGSTATALAHIDWGSKHFGDESFSPVDFSFGGSLGLQPALTLLTNPPAAGTTPAATTTPAKTVTSQYQSAFLWDLNASGNLHVGSNAELSGFGKMGQIRLLSGNGATIVDQGANSTLQIPLNGNADSLSWFWEGGAVFKYYAKSLEIIHAEKGQFDPAFEAGISYKRDNRFKQDTGVVGFDSPQDRLVFRFMVNAIKIVDRRPDTTASKPYTLSFGVEHERGFGANPLPSGTQIVIRGDVNLLKIINPGQ